MDDDISSLTHSDIMCMACLAIHCKLRVGGAGACCWCGVDGDGACMCMSSIIGLCTLYENGERV